MNITHSGVEPLNVSEPAKVKLPPLREADIHKFNQCVERTNDPDACWLWRGYVMKSGYGRTNFGGVNQSTHRIAYRIDKGEIPDGLMVCHSCDNRICVNPDHLWLGTQKDNMKDMIAKGRAATGDRNASRLYPEKLHRGQNHWAKRMPEKIPRGESHWAHQKPPEAFIRGDAHYSRTHPEKLCRGDRHPMRNNPDLPKRGDENGMRIHAPKLTMKLATEIRSRGAGGAISQAVLATEYGVSRFMIGLILRNKRWAV